MSNKKRKTEVVYEYMGMDEREDIPRNVTIVRFHSSVTYVGDSMFRGCEQLKKVVFNEGLKKIGRESFYECRSLESVTLPSAVIEIGSYAFGDCKQLKKVVFNEGLLRIGRAAFDNCYRLECINLPSTLVEIDDSSFHCCHSLKGVVLNEGLRKIGDSSFWRCNSLEHIIFPSSMIEIEDSAFCTCNRLETVILNEGLKKIEQYVFACCKSLERITIPSTVTEISQYTFGGCKNLREIGLHEGIERIPQSAFDGLSLQRLKFPNLSTRLETIIQLGQTEVEDKIDNISDLVERSGSEMFVSDVRFVHGLHWITTRGILGRIDRLLTYYELKEATTLLELALWKSNINQAEMKHTNRVHYRIDIPGPVKNTILQYLDFRV